MQPASVAQQNAQTAQAPITGALRSFYGSITGKPSSKQAEGDITKFNKMTPATADILRAFDQRYGVNDAATRVGELRKSVMNAEDLVRNVDDNVFARTSDALVSDAQRARLTAAEKDPLLKQLDVINRGYDLANQDLSGAREQSSRFSGAELSDIDTMRGELKTRLTTSQQREAEAARKKQQEEENRRWWKNFYEQKRQFESQMAAQQRQLDAQIRASQASSNALLRQIDAQNNASKRASQEAARQKAIAQEAARRAANKPKSTGYINKSNSTGGGTGGLIRNGWENVQKYGPLALFGGGTLWGW